MTDNEENYNYKAQVNLYSKNDKDNEILTKLAIAYYKIGELSIANNTIEKLNNKFKKYRILKPEKKSHKCFLNKCNLTTSLLFF